MSRTDEVSAAGTPSPTTERATGCGAEVGSSWLATAGGRRVAALWIAVTAGFEPLGMEPTHDNGVGSRRISRHARIATSRYGCSAHDCYGRYPVRHCVNTSRC